jgi:hypothetical protein
MYKPAIFSFCKAILILLFSMTISGAYGQSWMEGYNYRRNIDLNKEKVPGNVNLLDFPVLISLTDPDLKYIAGQCAANKISSKGLDISFALASAPADPVPFQVEQFDPATGTLTCWVHLSSLPAAGSIVDESVLYLYYGSNLIHDPHGSNAVGTWPAGLFRRWHFNRDIAPASVMNVKSQLATGMAVGSSGMGASNFVPGRVGTGVQLNGSSEFLSAARDTSRNFTISFWVRFNRVDQEQVILTNDSTGFGGYTVKINSAGRLMLDTKSGSIPLSLTAASAMLPNVWYFVSVIGDGKRRGIYINGKSSSAITRTQAIGQGGTITIGRSKQKDKYFGGRIDELSIEVGIRSAEWIEAGYNNQSDPLQFYTMGIEERSEVIMPTGYVFNGTVNNQWNEARNWNLRMVPEPYANVTVKAGVHLQLRNVADAMISQLTIDSAASLTVTNGLQVICSTNIAKDAILELVGDAQLQLDGDLLNNGAIRTEDTRGTLIFSGHGTELNISGAGHIQVFRLQNDLGASDGMVNIHQPLVVTGTIKVISGVLNSFGNLKLAASEERAASLSAVENLAAAAVTGIVQVEKYVSGNFPAPATGRGWRLWSPPVYAATANGAEMSNLSALKEALFVTGKGGSANGFDSSPQNGNTIYTHDQSIVGTLSQKYVAIPNMDAGVALGKGIYVYSRGSRNAVNAFRDQVQVAPFSNPEPYTITYKGNLFVGDLKVDVHSRNQGASGDGFNLLGNPYASPIRWGSVTRENVGEFVWMFNPLNNAYDVTDNPGLVIPAAEGFFVKVNSGAASGSLTFDEGAKLSDTPPAAVSRLSAIPAPAGVSAAASYLSRESSPKLEVTLSTGIFAQKYVLKLHPRFSDSTTDEDAVTVGEGFVNIAGLGANDAKLGVDSRELPVEEKSVRMFVKVWSGGRYHLNFSGLSTFSPGFSVLLLDNMLKTATTLTTAAAEYTFDVDVNVPGSQGTDRFTILIKPEPVSGVGNNMKDPVRIYPNPFTDVLNLKAADKFPELVSVRIRDLLGQLVLSSDFIVKEVSDSLAVGTSAMKSGLYIIEVIDARLKKRIKTAKIIKL